MTRTVAPPEVGPVRLREFVPVDWDAPVDVEAYLRNTPKSATIRGQFFLAFAEAAKRNNVQISGLRERYVAFSEYPIREYLPIMVEAAALLYPDKPLRVALRAIGRAAFPVFAASLVGKVTLIGADRSAVATVRELEKAYSFTQPHAVLIATSTSDSLIELSLEHVYSFVDIHHVGVVEGFFLKRGFACDITVCRQSLSAARFRCEVRAKAT